MTLKVTSFTHYTLAPSYASNKLLPSGLALTTSFKAAYSIFLCAMRDKLLRLWLLLDTHPSKTSSSQGFFLAGSSSIFIGLLEICEEREATAFAAIFDGNAFV